MYFLRQTRVRISRFFHRTNIELIPTVVFPFNRFDGRGMNYEITDRTELSTDQQQTLVEIISDQSGHNLSFDAFTDQVLLLFEEISGFEMISDSESQTIINQLWSYYHGPDK